MTDMISKQVDQQQNMGTISNLTFEEAIDVLNTHESFIGSIPVDNSTSYYMSSYSGVDPGHDSSQPYLPVSENQRKESTSSEESDNSDHYDKQEATEQVKNSKASAASKKKNNRTNYTPDQIKVLEKTFHEIPYPDSAKIEELEKDLGISEARLKIWFQNKRARWRKSHKKQQAATHMMKPQQIPHGFMPQYHQMLHGTSQQMMQVPFSYSSHPGFGLNFGSPMVGYPSWQPQIGHNSIPTQARNSSPTSTVSPFSSNSSSPNSSYSSSPQTSPDKSGIKYSPETRLPQNPRPIQPYPSMNMMQFNSLPSYPYGMYPQFAY